MHKKGRGLFCYLLINVGAVLTVVHGWTVPYVTSYNNVASTTTGLFATAEDDEKTSEKQRRHVAVIGAGWGGLSAAYTLSKHDDVHVTLIDAAPRVGGLVRDGFQTINNKFPAEAGQHGFWNNYHNIYKLFSYLGLDENEILTEYAEQGQYSPSGLEAVWPVYRDQLAQLPTGIAQAAYTRFFNLPIIDRLSAFPLVLALSDFDDANVDAWERYDEISFKDLCIRLGVSKRCYEEAFEPMILTGLFAPGGQCSAAAALGMAYFFVLQSQAAFDVTWCRGNIGEIIFDPWIQQLQKSGNVNIKCNTKVTNFVFEKDTIFPKDRVTQLQITDNDTGNTTALPVDDVIIAVGAKALNTFVRFCPDSLGRYDEFRRFANLRGTSVLATRLFLDQTINIPYTANACWGFDQGVGMTMFDITAIHGTNLPDGTPGTIVEVDYYHANTLLVQSDEKIVEKVKADLDTILGRDCKNAQVVDAAVVKLPEAVNWYFPGSYKDMPDIRSRSVCNMFFAGDIVRTNHTSWSQEKAFVTGKQAANCLLDQPMDLDVIPVAADEVHVRFGRTLVTRFRELIGGKSEKRIPFIVDFLS